MSKKYQDVINEMSEKNEEISINKLKLLMLFIAVDVRSFDEDFVIDYELLDTLDYVAILAKEWNVDGVLLKKMQIIQNIIVKNRWFAYFLI